MGSEGGCLRIQRASEIDVFKSVMKLYPVLTPAYLLLGKCAVKGSSKTALQIRLGQGFAAHFVSQSVLLRWSETR